MTSAGLKRRIGTEAEQEEAAFYAAQRLASETSLMLVVAGLPAANATTPQYAMRKKPLDQIASWL